MTISPIPIRWTVVPAACLLAWGCAAAPRSDTAGGDGSASAAAGAAAGSDSERALAARKRFENPGGMWMPRQMLDQARTLQQLGIQIDPAALSDPTKQPLAAVVSLGGCTASFVSPDGLIITNHHCVQRALQFNATPDDNLVENGFLARARADEKWAGPSQRVHVANKMTDITATVMAGLAEIKDPLARHDAIDQREKEAIAACESGRPHMRCKIGSFFGGKDWQLIEYLEIRDVRLVYVPHRGIGNYGGEIDNWEWPRHTGDFSFYRAYVGKDGKPAEHSADNVPYRPAAFLKVQPAGVRANDLVFVVGYPGKTNRQMTAGEMRHAVEWTHPRYIDKARQKMAILVELEKLGGATAIKAGVSRQSVQNYLEKYEGILAGVAKRDLIKAKDAAEGEFREWAALNPSRKRYVDSLDAMALVLAEKWKAEKADEAWEDAIKGSDLLVHAMTLVEWVHEQEKPDIERDQELQERDRSLLIAAEKTFTRKFDPAIDRALWRLMLTRAAAEPSSASWLPGLLGLPVRSKVDAAAIDRALDRFYAKTKLADEKVRLGLFDATPAQLKKSRDPFIRAAMALYGETERIEKRDDAWYGALILLRPVYVEGLAVHAGEAVAPDANGTLRISYGTVRGYRPAPDKEAYAPFTLVTEIPAKNTGEKPFDAPPPLLDAIAGGHWGHYAAPELGSVPVDFLSDLDITNGNSGSPVLNARGELVGLAFDGNKEGLASDTLFEGETTRTITADIRYALWVADAVDQADPIVEELGITPSLDARPTRRSDAATR